MTSTAEAADVTFDAAANAAAMVGHHYRVEDYYEVGREKVREFARSLQDYHPVHWHEDVARDHGYDGLVAPVTFAVPAVFMAQRRLFETVVIGYDLSQVMQTDQAIELRRPLAVGDRLTCDVYLHSFRQAFGGDLLTVRTVVTDQREEVVVVAHTGLVGRSGAVDGHVSADLDKVLMSGLAPGQAPVTRPQACDEPTSRRPVAARSGTHARGFDAVQAGDVLPERTVRLQLGDLVNYAGVSGDPNPIHWSPDVARRVGLDAVDGGVVAHGMLTMGIGAGYLAEWLGDPGAVLDYGVRFTSPVYVSADRAGEVVYTGKVKSVDSVARTAVIAITATHEGKKIFGRATATVQLGS
jgi:acyl dehydratase